ncbi:hypothetical protein MLD38_033713 [Melastoma candidum]|uniref:Uncharacterized protein n=1 Tax=Melastoma candidum TaxID=119954 RepID=A0ACB9M879_9MYRT|nr:hypothetical protein MLD38_033713 [Melastoma candidum]
MASIGSCCFASCVSAVGVGCQRSRHVFKNKGSYLSPHLLCYHRWNLKLRGRSRRTVSFSVWGSLLKVEDDKDESCELVSGMELSLGEGEDVISAYLFKAVKNNNGAGILLLSDIFGFEDSSTRDFAYRVACNGYNVLVPDLFRGDPWTNDRPRNLFEQWRARQTWERVSRDITTATEWMVGEFLAAGISKKLGIIGFCFGGGQLISVLANDQALTFGAAISFYGTRMDSSAAANMKIPVLFISGDEDPLCPVTGLEGIQKTIGRDSKVVIFKGRGHGFAHRPGSPEEDKDAEEAFAVMRNWLSGGLLGHQLN